MVAEPDAVAGVVACWVADDIGLADGASISSWVDRISGLTLAASGTQRPKYLTDWWSVNEQPAVSFNTAGESTQILEYVASDPVSVANAGGVFVVMVQPDGTDGLTSTAGRPWASGDESNSGRRVELQLAGLSDYSLTVFASGPGGTSSTLRSATGSAPNTPLLFEAGSDGTNQYLRYNGTQLGAVGSSGRWFDDVTGRDQFTVGGYKFGATLIPMATLIAAVIVVDGAVTTGQRDAIYDWFAVKYLSAPDPDATAIGPEGWSIGRVVMFTPTTGSSGPFWKGYASGSQVIPAGGGSTNGRIYFTQLIDTSPELFQYDDLGGNQGTFVLNIAAGPYTVEVHLEFTLTDAEPSLLFSVDDLNAGLHSDNYAFAAGSGSLDFTGGSIYGVDGAGFNVVLQPSVGSVTIGAGSYLKVTEG